VDHTRSSIRDLPRRRGLILVLVVLAAAALWWKARSHAPTSIPRSQLGLAARQPRDASRPVVPRLAPSLPSSPSEPVLASGGLRASERHWHPRDPQEWQGMLINTDASPPCESSAGCGLGRACKQGKCEACAQDNDCAMGEACVLDHCVVGALAACQGRADCAAGQLCVLSGYSNQARGNEGMRAYCLDPDSGTSSVPAAAEPTPDPRTRLPDDDLLDRAREAARKAPG
jgi:hypothetical protein